MSMYRKMRTTENTEVSKTLKTKKGESVNND